MDRRRLDIVFAVPDFAPAVGGTNRQTAVQARALADRGHRVVIVTRRSNNDWPRREELDGLEVHRVGAPAKRLLADRAALITLASWLFAHRRRVDVVQTVMWPDAVLAAALAGVLDRTAVLWAISGEVRGALAPAAGARGRAVGLRRRALGRSPQVVLTAAMSAEFDEVGLRVDVRVIPVPVDRRHFRPPTPEERAGARASLGMEPGGFTIAYVGHLEPRKAVDRLVRAFATVLQVVPDARLLLVGGSRERDDTMARLQRQVTDEGLEGGVSFCGVVDDPRPHLWAADALALASFREGMPNSILEAMACGLPCVAPPSAGGAELLADGAGLVPASNDPDELAGALLALATDAELRARLGKAGVLRARDHDVDKVIDDYERLYAQLARR
jgi:glycosyltransferase involved in cell wall biosynthesis